MITHALLDRHYFESLTQYLFGLRKAQEHLFVTLNSEKSQFIRLNAARVRQIGTIEDALFEISMIYESAPGQLHKSVQSLTLTGLLTEDQDRLFRTLKALRTEVVQLPADPYAEIPRGNQTSSAEKKGQPLPEDTAASKLLEPWAGKQIDIAGIYASGPTVRAMASTSGQLHWFRTENFSLDYSLYTPSQRALKGTFAGSHWVQEKFRDQLQADQKRLEMLLRNPKKVPKGSYRCYLAPAAVSDLIRMFNWGCVSEASIRQGDSPLRKIRSGEKEFSKQFSLSEDFRGGEIPRFNAQGDLSVEFLPLVEKGKFLNSLVGSRTSKEYGILSNYAEQSESMRSPSLAAGDLAELSNDTEILKTLGTGLYLSNLHYLNWSDQPGGRITGMTRYACFWVENGEIVAPIENMRFDDSIFNLFGDHLAGLTSSRTYLPEVGSYFARGIGGIWAPGMLISQMNFTL